MEDIKIKSNEISCEWIVEAQCKATKDELCKCLKKLQNNLNNNREIRETHDNHISYSGACWRAKSALWVSLWSHHISEDNSKEIRENNKEIIKQAVKDFFQKTNPDPYSFPTHTYRRKDIWTYIIEFTTRWVKNSDINHFKSIK